MKVVYNTENKPAKAKFGDIVEMDNGTCVILKDSNTNFPVRVVKLPTFEMVNSLKSLNILNEKGCFSMGRVKHVYEDAELLLGGRQNEC